LIGVSEAAAEVGRLPTLRVLLCDDDPVMSDALSDLVTHAQGFDLVGVAGDADSVGALAETLQPDVVLLDVRMPGGGGPRAARLIRRRASGARLVVFSAHSDRRTVLEMLRAGASEFLVKGINSDVDILDALQRTSGGRLGLSQGETEELVVDIVDLLAVTEARLSSANENLVRLGSTAQEAAAEALALLETTLQRLGPHGDAEGGDVRQALEEVLSGQRRVVDSLAAATTVARAHALDSGCE
jgi:DNA-binding NarL/FixJ family response regulator